MARRIQIALIAILVVIIALGIAELSIFRVLSYRIYDTIIWADYILNDKDKLPVYDDISIVDIDENSIQNLGQFSRWPTLFFADLVDIINEDKPKLIAFDVFFTEPDSISNHAKQRLSAIAGESPDRLNKAFDLMSTDYQFARAMQNAGNVFLAMFNSPVPREDLYLPSTLYPLQIRPKHYLKTDNPYPPIQELAESAYGVGFAHIQPDESGKIHDYPLFLRYLSNYYVNFSFQACLDLLQIDSVYVGRNAKLYSDSQLSRSLPLSRKGKFYLKYYGPEGSFRYISFSDVIKRKIAPGYFTDKIILVGSSAAGLRDFRTSPMDPTIPGVELHATLMRNVLTEDYVKWVDPYLTLGLLLVLILIVAVMIYSARPLISFIFFAVVNVLLFIGFYLLYVWYSYTMNYAAVLLPWTLCYLSLLYDHYTHQIKEKKKVRNAFEHYVSKDVISHIMTDPSFLKIGGEKKYVSVLFADIRNFSSYCEVCPANELTDFLHTYFNRTTNFITDNKGLLDKYIGDAIVALYNVPIPYEDFQYYACRSALGIVEQANILRDEYIDHEILHDFAIGVGIGTGDLIIGNMGSDRIFNYTGIGDTMNLSSRLEGLNKYYHTSIIINENTYNSIKDRFFCRYMDCVSVKGKQKANKLYELISYLSDVSEESDLYHYVQHYEKAMFALYESKIEIAVENLHIALKYRAEDYLCMMMLTRIENLDLRTWKGVWQHSTK